MTAALLVTAFSVSLSKCCGQGSLTAPGPPTATMLTLSQVEPRTPVDAVHTLGNLSAAFVITNSGSYYLTTNIVVNSAISAIDIVANNVTLDLNGFSVLGASVGVYGVNIQIGYTNVSVCNGLVSGWTQYGISCAGAHVDLDQLNASGNTLGGVILFGSGGGCFVRNSIFSGNTGYGVYSSVNDVTCEHLMVCSNNPGILFSGVASGVVKDCAVYDNLMAGIECYSSTNISLQDVTTSHNNGYGIYLPTSQNITISDCQINGNGMNAGIYLASSSCFILGSSCSGNGTGIFVQGANNQIDGNHVIGSNPSAVGIWLNSAAGVTNNIVTRNNVVGYGINDYSLGVGNIAGPIISSAASGIVTNSNPWANIGF